VVQDHWASGSEAERMVFCVAEPLSVPGAFLRVCAVPREVGREAGGG